MGCDGEAPSRRRALQLGDLGVACVVVGGTGPAGAGTTQDAPVQGETDTAPTVLTSTDGALTVTLEPGGNEMGCRRLNLEHSTHGCALLRAGVGSGVLVRWGVRRLRWCRHGSQNT